jgi:hypothetical protein
MKSFAGFVALGFARKMVVEKPVEVVQVREPLAFTIKPVFDFSSYAEAGKTCDIRMGTTLSLIDCGTSFSTFDTVSAITGELNIPMEKYALTY